MEELLEKFTFVSYRQVDENTVRRLVNDLEKNYAKNRVKTWFASRDLGNLEKAIAPTILQKIEDCHSFLLCLGTPIEEKEKVTQDERAPIDLTKEIVEALRRQKRDNRFKIIPVLLKPEAHTLGEFSQLRNVMPLDMTTDQKWLDELPQLRRKLNANDELGLEEQANG